MLTNAPFTGRVEKGSSCNGCFYYRVCRYYNPRTCRTYAQSTQDRHTEETNSPHTRAPSLVTPWTSRATSNANGNGMVTRTTHPVHYQNKQSIAYRVYSETSKWIDCAVPLDIPCRVFQTQFGQQHLYKLVHIHCSSCLHNMYSGERTADRKTLCGCISGWS